jgi:putative intracellular protease/amidase
MCRHSDTDLFKPEFAHPYDILSPLADITVASPLGGEAPLDPSSVAMFKDDISVNFHKKKSALWKNTQKLSSFKGRMGEFDAIFYVGGHGRK